MSRITKLPYEQWSPQLRSGDGPAPSAIELGISRIIAHRPEIALGLGQFTSALRLNRTLPERLMELVRLRIAFFNQCRSCMAVRYASAVDDGLDEGAVCSLERPAEAADLSHMEKAAIRYGELMATDHLAIGDAVYDDLRVHFTEPQIVELGLWCALCVGIGRLAASWDMVEDLPEGFQSRDGATVTPWRGETTIVSRPVTQER
jgi:AhpD family alkylhydroperoxidase